MVTRTPSARPNRNIRNIRSNRIKCRICPVQQDGIAPRVSYYETVEKIAAIKKGFAQRLFELRSIKGVSAREMSLSLGQGSGYISNLENQHNLPSMSQFFAICEYLGITPSAFFAFDSPEGEDIGDLMAIVQTLRPDDVQLVLAIARRMQRKDRK